MRYVERVRKLSLTHLSVIAITLTIASLLFASQSTHKHSNNDRNFSNSGSSSSSPINPILTGQQQPLSIEEDSEQQSSHWAQSIHISSALSHVSGLTKSFLSDDDDSSSALDSTMNDMGTCSQSNRHLFPSNTLLSAPMDSDITNPLSSGINGRSSKYAYIHTLDITQNIIDQIYGIIAFHGALKRTQSTYDHVVLAPISDGSTVIDSSVLNALDSIGIIVIKFDPSPIDSVTPSNTSEPFHRLHVLTLSQYEKVLLVGYDMVVISNIDMVFTFPTPAAPPERYSALESNIGAFLLTPDDNTYDIFMATLPKVKDWLHNGQTFDAYNTEGGTTQGLLNAVFWDSRHNLGPIYMLPYQYAISTNKLANERQRYFLWWRKSMIRMVEFVDDYPTSSKARDRFRGRVKMLRTKKRLGWPETVTTHYMIRFWLDFDSILQKCGDICENLNFKSEIETAQNYLTDMDEPFPFVTDMDHDD